MTYCTRKSKKHIYNSHNTIKLRSLKNYNKETYSSLLESCDWSSIKSSRCVNAAWSNFKTTLTNIIDKVAPIKTVRIKQRTQPWMTSDILEKIHKRNKLSRLLNKGNGNASFSELSSLRNAVQHDIKKAKANYFRNKLEDNINQPKKLWKTLKDLGYSTKPNSKSKIVLNVNGSLLSDTLAVCNQINHFFTNVAQTLTSKLPSPSNLYSVTSDKFKSYYQGKVSPGEFFLKEVDNKFIYDELSNLDTNKAFGLDGIAPRFLKDGAKQLAPIVSHIVNLSISTKTVPNDMKQAKIIPIYKKKSRLEVSNYRPISLLSVVSKVLEKCVYVQVNEYLNSKNLIYDYQSGFRSGYSTETCLVYLTDYIRSKLSEGKYVGMCLLDVQKAFDSVNHSILCQKLEAMGINSLWFKSYLSNRHQLVCIDDTESRLEEIPCGVPQGSLLGPLLYLCYSNDMVTAVKNKLLLYADDSVIITSDKNPETVAHDLSCDMKAVNGWLIDNQLSMHVGKTELILFGTSSQLNKVKDFHVPYDGHIIQPTDSVKYLGAALDKHLSGEAMVDSIIKKATSRLKFLYRHSKFFNRKLRRDLCSALIQCHIDYCSAAWYSGLTKKYQQKLQVIQNKMVRFILELPPRKHVGQEQFQSLKFLDIQNRTRQLRLKHVHSVFYSTAPSYLSQFFLRTSEIHSHGTRANRLNFWVPRVKGQTSKSFFYNSIIDWNSLPDSIKQIPNKLSFKQAVKAHLASCSKAQDLAAFV